MERKTIRVSTLYYTVAGLIGVALIVTVIWFVFQEYQFNRYINEQTGISIKYPSDWRYTENEGGAAVIFLSPLSNKLDVFRETVNIVIQDLSNNPMTLDRYTDVAIHQMEVVFKQHFVKLDSAPTLVAGRPGHRLEFLGKTPNNELHYLIVWTIKDQKAYQVTFTAISSQYDQYVGIAKAMIRSFKIL